MLDVFDRFYQAHWLLSGFSNRGFVHDFPVSGGCPYITRCYAIMDNGVNAIIFEEEEYNRAATFQANRLVNDHVWRELRYQHFYECAERYYHACERCRHISLRQLSDNDLTCEVGFLLVLHERVRTLGVLLNGLVIDGRNHLSNAIRDKLRVHIPTGEFERYWSTMTRVTRFSKRQERDFKLGLLAARHSHLSACAISSQLEQLRGEYGWLDYMYLGPPTSERQFHALFEEAITEPDRFLNIPLNIERIRAEQQNLADEIRLPEHGRFLLELAKHVIWQKGYRKDIEYHGFFCYEFLLREIARRAAVPDWQLLTYLLPWELGDYLVTRPVTADELKQRRDFSCLIVDKSGTKLVVGDEARAVYAQLGVRQGYADLLEVTGQCAVAGKAKGRVTVVNTRDEIDKMREGDVLVSQATSPDLLPAMLKATAIVTNVGGLICHAAILAREFGIPCVVGTVNGTLALRDGDLVEVDAERGVIRRAPLDQAVADGRAG